MEKFSSHFFLEIVCGVFVSVTMDWGGGCGPFLFVNLSQVVISFSISIGLVYHLTVFPLPRLQTRVDLPPLVW